MLDGLADLLQVEQQEHRRGSQDQEEPEGPEERAAPPHDRRHAAVPTKSSRLAPDQPQRQHLGGTKKQSASSASPSDTPGLPVKQDVTSVYSEQRCDLLLVAECPQRPAGVNTPCLLTAQLPCVTPTTHPRGFFLLASL